MYLRVGLASPISFYSASSSGWGPAWPPQGGTYRKQWQWVLLPPPVPNFGMPLCMAKCCKRELRTARMEASRAFKPKPNLYKAPNPKSASLNREFQLETQLCPWYSVTPYTQLHPACCPQVFKAENNSLHTRQNRCSQKWTRVEIGRLWIFLLIMADITLHAWERKSVKDLMGTKHAL